MRDWEEDLLLANLEEDRRDVLGQLPVMIMGGREVRAVEIDSEIAFWMGGF